MIKTVFLALGAVIFICPVTRLNAQILPTPPPVTSQTGLTLSNLVQLVLERNEKLQASLIDFEASHQKHLAEKGVFEPDLVGSVSHEVNNRPNNAQQQNEDQNSILHESNNIYDGGIESLLPTGTKLHLGYTLSDLNNNILPSGLFSSGLNSNLNQLQYQSFFGVTVDQPLLKNFGPAVTMAGMRIAALQSKIAFQEYRRQMMDVIYQAEKSYWFLYYEQEQERALEQSLANAEMILKDNRTKLEAGKSSEQDVIEAQSGVATRRAALATEHQKRIEYATTLVYLYAGRMGGSNDFIHAADVPVLRDEQPDIQALDRNAFISNPEYLIQQEKVDQELIRLGYARNQRLPEFDLKGAYGLNGLGATPGASWDDIERSHYPSWTIGAEFRIPLGMTKARHEYTAAEMQLQSAELNLQDVQSKVFNGLEAERRKLASLRDVMDSYQVAADNDKKIYEIALVRQQEGKLETGKVFDDEADWLNAQAAAVKSLVEYQVAWIELQVLDGSLLQQHNIELTQEDLKRTTRDMMKHGRIQPNARYMQGNNEQNGYYPAGNASSYDDNAVRDALHKREKEMDQQQPASR